MEYYETDLSTILDNKYVLKQLSLSILIKWFTTIAESIQCIHDNGY